MRLIYFAILVGFSSLAYVFWTKMEESRRINVHGSTYSENGFVTLPGVLNQDKNTVYVIAPENCPRQSAIRARQLAQDLKNQGISVVETHRVNYSFTTRPSKEVIDRMNGVMEGEIPIVMINGRGKANPSLGEVVAEYRRSGAL
jgi:hypothetical protein